MARRTKEEALETRNCLLDTALHLFCVRGIVNTTLTDIASEAGLTRGAVYWHFKNKADIFAALWARLREPLDELATISESPSQPYPLERLREFLVAVLRTIVFQPEHQQIFRLLIKRSELDGELQGIGEQLKEAHAAFRARIERILSNALNRGQLPEGYPLELGAFLVHSALDGVVLNWLEDGRNRDLAAEAPQIVDALLVMALRGLSTSTLRAG
ncbi:TetR family transcriptional regulator [Marinobacterium nitratireducens]|uniref:TetR family transcriptional regulator n=1 Tax=Marinobacterium nitratireducens TaxID=518897 RepID=A0A918DPL7_9GAMM|nr:TetR family transcriptional regulator [Marinobacterium nitratireducens]GGO78757.1 TetR family transcriptional regulator [Marinobacterium nitratireducens]